MGMSLYVMPLRTYLTGRFKTTWEIRSELTGKSGFLITPEGLRPGPPPRETCSDEEAALFLASLRDSLEPLLGLRPEWDEEGEVAQAVSMSYSSFGLPMAAAARYPGVHDFLQLRRLEETWFWLPVAFESPFRVPHPFDPEERMVVGSSSKLCDEMVRLERLLVQEPEMAEVESIPEGGSISGPLLEFWERVQGVRLMLRLAALSAERRLPLVAEG